MPLDARTLLDLQRTAGNQRVNRLLLRSSGEPPAPIPVNEVTIPDVPVVREPAEPSTPNRPDWRTSLHALVSRMFGRPRGRPELTEDGHRAP
jgi:hypothetical protein